MNVNVGTMDRLARLLVGLALAAAAIFSGLSIFDDALIQIGVVIVGLILVVTAIMSRCPLYSLFGIRSCRV